MTRKFEDLFRFSIFICAVPPNESKKTVSVDVWTQCPPPSSRFRVFTGMSLEQCAAECEARPACAVLGYLRTPHVCELYEQPAGVDECEPVRIVDHGKILGNRYDVGAKLRVLCDVGYVAENNMTSMTCGANGSWSHVASCVLKFNKTSVVNSSQSTLESVCPKTKSEFTSNVTQTLPGYPGTEFIFVKQHHTLNDSKNACENMGGLKIRSWVDGEKEGDDWKYHDGTLMDVGNSSIWNNKYEPKINDTCVRLKKSTFLLVGINNQ
ncbi:hypothetical protein MAR_022720, partial [Mya arenaria]